MIMSISKGELQLYVKSQLETLFPDGCVFHANNLESVFDSALDRLEYCFKHIAIPAYNRDDNTYFNHLHGDQYSQFLYFLSNSLWQMKQDRQNCDKLMQLNRMLSGCFWSYNSGLPDIFFFRHPVGTVLGNAPYGDFFAVCQNCTVKEHSGYNNSKEERTSFGKGLFLGAGAQILNKDICIEDWVAVGAGTKIYKESRLEESCLIYEKDGINHTKKRTMEKIKKMGIFKPEYIK